MRTKWRHDWGVVDLLSKGERDLSYEEILTCKSFYLGVDRLGRPISYVSVRDHVKGQFSAQATEKLTVLSMETGRKLLRSPIESVTVVFDLTEFALKNMDYQHLKFLINLLETFSRVIYCKIRQCMEVNDHLACLRLVLPHCRR